MPNRWSSTSRLIAVVSVYAASCAIARADLYTIAFNQAEFTFYWSVQHYSNAGGALGSFGSIEYESVDSLITGANGNLYLVTNTLGGGQLFEFNPSTGAQLTLASTPQIGSAAQMAALPNGNILVPSTQFLPGTVSGVLEFNGSSGSYIHVAIPQGSTELGSVGFNPTNNQLYVTNAAPSSNSGIITQYSYSPAIDSFTPNAAFHSVSTQLSISEIQVRPGDSDFYVGTTTEIDQYDANGNFLSTFATASAGGQSGIGSFAFGDDGYLYVSTGASLLRYNASTGSFIDNLGSISGYDLTYVAPEPATFSAAILPLYVLCSRRRRARA